MDAAPDADWYTFLDADDYLAREALTEVSFALDAEPEVKAFFGGGVILQGREERDIGEDIWPMSWEDWLRNLNRGTVGPGGFFAGPEARELRSDESIGHCEGFEFWLAFAGSYEWRKLREPLCVVDKDAASCDDHYHQAAPQWERAFWGHAHRWEKRGRVRLTQEELAARHFAERERKLCQRPSGPNVMVIDVN
jgi:hypothetical protein